MRQQDIKDGTGVSNCLYNKRENSDKIMIRYFGSNLCKLYLFVAYFGCSSCDCNEWNLYCGYWSCCVLFLVLYRGK